MRLIATCLGLLLSCSLALGQGWEPKVKRGAVEIVPWLTTSAERADYAERIEKLFLSSGSDVHAQAVEDPKDHLEEKPPFLFLYGWWSRVSIYQLGAKSDLLESTRRMGFTALVFLDRGNDGYYIFRLPARGALPKCALHNRVCL